MSSLRKNFSFGEYGEAIYPKDIDVLNRLYDAISLHCLKKCQWFTQFLTGLIKGKWYQIAELSINDGKMLIFFPWRQDWEGDIQLDQSIAVCVANISEEKYLAIFKNVLDIFWEEYFSKPSRRSNKLPEKIFSRVLDNGKNAVPKWYVNVRAFLHPVPGGDPFLSHLAARKWFEDQGYCII
jgi:hypothetical protein